MDTTTDDVNETSNELTMHVDNNQKDCNEKNNSAHNLSALDTTQVSFDETLPPGAAPDGFVIVDEDIANSSLDTSINENDSDGRPIFKVLFKDSSAYRNYHKKIGNFLKELIELEGLKGRIINSTSNLVVDIFDFPTKYRHSPIVFDVTSKEKQTNDALFTIDTKPKFRDDYDVPVYGKKFSKALEKSKANVEVKEDNGPKMTCFNCLGNHNLRDCDQPKNYAAISKNRKGYNLKRGPSSVRYHLDDDQKYGHFVPGQLSSNLRIALGISENELPTHIYHMRRLGYPPGWLEEARLQHSGLALFNDKGQVDVGSDEEGEIVTPGDKDKYDVKKIIDFPGFNTLPAEGTIDQELQYWGSSMQEHYSKIAMLSYLSDKKTDDGYKRKKLTNPAVKMRTAVNPGEMELDEVEDTPVECVPVKDLFIPPLPKDDIPEPPPPPPPPPAPGVEDSDNQQSPGDISINSNGESTEPSSRDGSPSLFDLECAKKQLLAELDESSSQSNPDSSKTGTPKLETLKTGVPESDSSKAEESDSSKTDVNNLTPKNSPKMQSTLKSGRKQVKVVHLGTPLLHSCSPFKRLPTSEKFSKDICDVINFENLPDATGKYDQMSELLQKVRTAVAEIQKE